MIFTEKEKEYARNCDLVSFQVSIEQRSVMRTEVISHDPPLTALEINKQMDESAGVLKSCFRECRQQQGLDPDCEFDRAKQGAIWEELGC